MCFFISDCCNTVVVSTKYELSAQRSIVVSELLTRSFECGFLRCKVCDENLFSSNSVKNSVIFVFV